MLPVMFYTTILSVVFLVHPAISQSEGFDHRNIDDNTDNFSRFGKELYRLCTSTDVFQKVFMFSITEEETAEAFYNSAEYFARKVGLKNPGSLLLQVELASVDSFVRGGTFVQAFKVFSNAMEAYLTDIGVLNPDNVEQLAFGYYVQLENVLREVEETNQAAFLPAAVYISSAASANYVVSFGEQSQEVLRRGTAFFAYQWNNVAGTRSVEECRPIFQDVYQKYFDECFPQVE